MNDQVRPTITLEASDLLYEDDFIIAVNKPAGVPTQGTRDATRDHLLAALTRLLEGRDGKTPYLALHHRLDRDTSGVLVLSRAKKANKGLARAFRERLATKTYRALSQRRAELAFPLSPGVSWEVDNHLARARGASTHRQTAVFSGGDRARTDFELLGVHGELAYVEARPRTGRTHQIRVHLGEGGLPILGDAIYGGPSRVGTERIERVMLHAMTLSLPHPVTGELLTIESPLPEDFLALGRRLGVIEI